MRQMIAPPDGKRDSAQLVSGTWNRAEAAVDFLAAESSNLAEKTVENVRIFLRFAVERYQAPDEIGLGYWPTVRLTWSQSSPPIEVEVFDDHYEFYRFAGEAAEIRHVAAVDDIFPEDLKRLLDEAIPVSPVRSSIARLACCNACFESEAI